MSQGDAELFAKSVDEPNADLEYVEATIATQSSTKTPITEATPKFQAELKSTKTKNKRKKVKAKVFLATDGGMSNGKQ